MEIKLLTYNGPPVINSWTTMLDPPREITTKLTAPRKKEDVPDDLLVRYKREQHICATADCWNARWQYPHGAYASYCRECRIDNIKLFRKRLAERGGGESERSRLCRLGICAAPGCDEPRQVYSSGKVASRCKKHRREARKLCSIAKWHGES